MATYDHKEIEAKWQKIWLEEHIYETKNDTSKPKYYVLDMFPYPSGSGLHVGHPRGYISSDVFARLKRMQGYNVLHPMGYDAFGLPAEQFAVKNKIHPREAVEQNVATFENQLSIIGLSYDWSRKVNTTDPKYYKWTQWIFLELFGAWYDKTKNKARKIDELISLLEKEGNQNVSAVCDADTGVITASEWQAMDAKSKETFLMKYRLAYEGYSEVNWSPTLGTVLANDEVVVKPDGSMVGERDGEPVIKKSMRQWFMRITAYAERLLSGLEKLDWSEHIKEIQRNWIGKSEGAEITFALGSISGQDDGKHTVKIFTTRPDTLFGATFLAISAELALRWIHVGWQCADAVKEFAEQQSEEIKKNTQTRGGEKEKLGIDSGIFAIHPLTKERIPVWVTNYVLGDVGTGAIMAVPAHDERDFDFAQKYNLPIKQVVQTLENSLPTTLFGTLVNSGDFNGMTSSDAKSKITKMVDGKLVTKYKIRDAVFARQRYWGEPIPLKHMSDGTIQTLSLKELPLVLPDVASYEPTGTGESPLAGIDQWMSAGYETNTMPGWAGSSWYFLRYMDPNNDDAFASPEALNYWKNVDMYIGGAEHATGHLLYSRFWHKFLFDFGYVQTEEPFLALRNQGMILALDGRKMSKRWGNVVNPDEVVKTFGADTLRLYELFIGPFDAEARWSTESIIGPRRFIERVWGAYEKVSDSGTLSSQNEILLNQTIKKITEDIEGFRFNTAVSQLMICLSGLEKEASIPKNVFETFIILCAPFIPHVTEELWQKLGHKETVSFVSWPLFDVGKLESKETIVVVQINGKVRAELLVDRNITEAAVVEKALNDPKVKEYIGDKVPTKTLYIKGKLVSIVLPT